MVDEPEKPSGDDKAARLAEALRANLRRRKSQAKKSPPSGPITPADTDRR